MKIRTAFIFLTAVVATPVWAENPAEIELLSAQKAYQAALKHHANSHHQTTVLQTQLQEAKMRLQHAETEVYRLQQALNQADAERQQADSALQSAGARLDAAWQASRNRY